MHSLESYLRRQSTERLQQILAYSEEYSEDNILLIQRVLSERSPFPGDLDEMDWDKIEKEDL